MEQLIYQAVLTKLYMNSCSPVLVHCKNPLLKNKNLIYIVLITPEYYTIFNY